MLALAFLGFLDAAYLTIEHFLGAVPPCSVLKGCEVVTTSGYAMILGVPVALLGAIYYLVALCVLVRHRQTQNQKAIEFLKWLMALGLLASLYFVFIQLFVLHAICLYCLGSAFTSTLLCILIMIY